MNQGHDTVLLHVTPSSHLEAEPPRVLRRRGTLQVLAGGGFRMNRPDSRGGITETYGYRCGRPLGQRGMVHCTDTRTSLGSLYCRRCASAIVGPITS